jgi:hypothetical protein
MMAFLGQINKARQKSADGLVVQKAMLGLNTLNKQQEITAPQLCSLLLAVFGPNTCCNYKNI